MPHDDELVVLVMHPLVIPLLCSAAENLKIYVSQPEMAFHMSCAPRRLASYRLSAVVVSVFQLAVVCAACSVMTYGSVAGEVGVSAGRVTPAVMLVALPTCQIA